MMAGVYDIPASGEANASEADLRAIGRSLWDKKALILGPTLLAAAAALFIAGSMTPQYRSEARVLVENNDTVYTRPEGAQTATLEADALAVQSQVQLLLSRDLARQVVTDFKLAEIAEFDPAGGAVSFPKRMMILLGLSRDPLRMNAEERVLDTYFRHLQAYAVPESRVIVVEFSSSNPETAANVANGITDRYLALQQSAKQISTRRASTWLSSQIKDLSGRVAEAEAKVEEFRSQSNLFLGTNNATITTQQLGELNTELARARGQEADARAKAELIRDTLKAKRPVESLDLANSELIRGLSQQRVQLGAEIAREGRTYLPGHPRMKELQAQVNSLDAQIKDEGAKLARAYENEARLAADRVNSVQSTIDAQKKVVGSAGGQEVQLRALEREAKAQRDLLEQFLARYRDAAARERVEAIPPDARVISSAMPTNIPYSPKPLAITLLTAIGVFVLMVVGVTASEFMIVPAAAEPRPAESRAAEFAPRQPVAAEPPLPLVVPSAEIVPTAPEPEPDLEPKSKSASFFARAASALKRPRKPTPDVVAEPVTVPVSVAPDDAPVPAEIASDPVPKVADVEQTPVVTVQSAQPESSDTTLAQGEPAAKPDTAAVPKAPEVAVFGKISAPSAAGPQAEQIDLEAADMRMLGELAAHLASMPKGDEGALNILTVASSSGVDSGGVALSLARSLASAGRKAIVLDAGSESRDFAAALPNPHDGGLGELIAGNTSFGQAIQRDRASAAHLIAPGSPSLLTTHALSRVGVALDALGLTYDFVIILAPPTERSADVAALAAKTGAAILVAHTQDAQTRAAHRALATAGVGDVILLLTDAAPPRPAEQVS